jgi:hypothetical protein
MDGVVWISTAAHAKIFIFSTCYNKAVHAQKENYACHACTATQNQRRSAAFSGASASPNQTERAQTIAFGNVTAVVRGVWTEFSGF